MARYQIILAYDGTDFSGSQRQAKARTVQGELEGALRRLDWQGKSVLLAGRTDTGVHATGQVAAFDLVWNHPLDELVSALNGHLPNDVAVRQARVAPDGFHPRFDATSRRYRYRLFCQAVRAPLRERYEWRVWPALDGELLSTAAQFFLGEHDFTAFGTSPRPGSSSVRSVVKAVWQATLDGWCFEVQANAFLYHMVRKMVFAQVSVAQKRLPLGVIADALENGLSNIPGDIAPAHGLTLVEVTYPDDLEIK